AQLVQRRQRRLLQRLHVEDQSLRPEAVRLARRHDQGSDPEEQARPARQVRALHAGRVLRQQQRGHHRRTELRAGLVADLFPAHRQEEQRQGLESGLGQHPRGLSAHPRDLEQPEASRRRGVQGRRHERARAGLDRIHEVKRRLATMRFPFRISARGSTATALAPALVGVALACLAPFASADRVVTQDGRILAPKKARPEGAGYKLEFEHGVIVVPDKSLVREVEIEGDMSDYVPQNDDEKQKLAQGYVKYRSRWMSAPAYQEVLRKSFEASKKRTEEIKAHSDWSNAWKKETKHFVFKTNTSPDLLDYYSELLEAYYD